MKDFMQSTNVEYKEEDKKENEKNVENFADIQNSIEEQERLEKQIDKKDKVLFWSDDPNILFCT